MPRDGELDVSTMTAEQLAEALENVDPRGYPANHRRLLEEHARRGREARAQTGFEREAREAAETRDYLRRYPGAPTIVWSLLAVNAVAYGLFTATGGAWLLPSPEALIRSGANYTAATLGGEPWRLLTGTFLHYGAVHLALNLWALYAAGSVAEKFYGHARFLVIYLGAGFAGSVASVWCHPVVISVGASGSIMGVVGALAAFLLVAADEVPASVRRSLLQASTLAAAAIVISGTRADAIDQAAHVGGLCAGFALGVLLADGPTARAASRESRWRFATGIAALIGAMLLALWAIETGALQPRRAQP